MIISNIHSVRPIGIKSCGMFWVGLYEVTSDVARATTLRFQRGNARFVDKDSQAKPVVQPSLCKMVPSLSPSARTCTNLAIEYRNRFLFLSTGIQK